MLNMFDAEAQVVQTADGLIPAKYRRAWTASTRARIGRERMKERGFLIPHVTKDKDGEEVASTPNRARSRPPSAIAAGVVIEPWLTDQWYVECRGTGQGAD